MHDRPVRAVKFICSLGLHQISFGLTAKKIQLLGGLSSMRRRPYGEFNGILNSNPHQSYYKMQKLYPRCICARGEAEGYKYHRGYNFYLILQQGTYFDARSVAEGILLINNTHSYPVNGSKSIKSKFYHQVTSKSVCSFHCNSKFALAGCMRCLIQYSIFVT